jgi:uncharacterized protein (DUF1015 family)
MTANIIAPLQGLRYNPEHVRLGGVLAPPYDVISDSKREQLYGRDLRNIVRVDYGAEYPDDVPGENDRYTRAAGFLRSWVELDILQTDRDASIYVSDHEFVHPDGSLRHRRGIFATVAARRWAESPLLPHERTLSAPKDDRLALLRATQTQTSPVFALWSGITELTERIDVVARGRALIGGRTDGEFGSEKHLLWRVSEPRQIAGFVDALRSTSLYVADGHHRYETYANYAVERRAGTADPPSDAPSERALVYLASADDPALMILPTHRLVLAGPGVAFSIDDLWARLEDGWEAEPAADLGAAMAAAASRRDTHHAFAVVASDGAAVLHRTRRRDTSPRDALDATVLESEVLAPAGVAAADITSGRLGYTRDLAELLDRVGSAEAVLGFGLQPVTAAEVLAVAGAGQTMPQKSTYFYPKVPTGLVLHKV